MYNNKTTIKPSGKLANIIKFIRNGLAFVLMYLPFQKSNTLLGMIIGIKGTSANALIWVEGILGLHTVMSL